MAERQLPELKSRLRLDTSDLDRADKAAKRFLKSLDDPKALAGTTARLDEMAGKFDRFGSTMTRNVTLPIVAVGGAAAKMAYDFNTSFNTMQTLAGVTADEVDGLKQTVKDLAVETGRSPDELAKALYFIRSAGFDSAAALEILRVSAQGAAVGLGDSAAIADAVTSVIGAYGAENITAAQAVDILTASAQEAKVEAADLAPELGRLLPIAAELGIEFGELTGSLAFLSKGGGGASEQATKLQGVMNQLVSPTAQARDELDKIGLSTESIKRTIREDGLLAALTQLQSGFKGNEEAIAKVFPDVRGFIGVLGLLRNGGEDAAKVIYAATNSVDSLGEAFRKIQGTDEFKFQQSLAQLQTLAIDVGESLLPFLSKVAAGVAGVAEVFASLPDPVQNAVVALALLTAALGPVAKLAGFATTGVSALLKLASSGAMDNFRLGLAGVSQQGAGAAASLGNLIRTIGTSPLALGAAAGAVGLLAVAYLDMEAAAKRARDGAEAVRSEAEQTGKSIEAVFNERLAKTIAGVAGGLSLETSGGAFKKAVADLGLSADELSDILLGSQEDFDAYLLNLRRGGEGAPGLILGYSLDALRVQALDAAATQAALAQANKELGVQTDDVTASTSDQAGATDELTDSSAAAADAMSEQAQEARDLFDAQQTAADSADAVTDAQDALAEAQRNARGDSEDMRRALQGVDDAEQSLADAQRSSTDAQQDLNRARKDAAENLQDLALSAEGAALSEEAARISLLEARQDEDLKSLDPLKRRRAKLRLDQADLALREAIDRRGDVSGDLAEAQRKGIEGSDAVVAAQQRVKDAADQETEAQNRVREATAEVAQVRVDSAEKVQQATEDLTKAQFDHIDAVAELAEAAYGAKTANDVMITGFTNLALSLDPADPLRKNLTSYIADLITLRDLNSSPVLEPTGPDLHIPQNRRQPTGPDLHIPRAQGGPVYPGRSYLVNENVNAIVPEVFVPDVQGRIVHGNKVTGGDLPPVNVSIAVQGQPDAATLATLERVASRAVSEGIRKAGRR